MASSKIGEFYGLMVRPVGRRSVGSPSSVLRIYRFVRSTVDLVLVSFRFAFGLASLQPE